MSKLSEKIKKNNSGAGIITVMIAIMFITALGTVLMMLAYTGLEMRVSDRSGKENLYDASAVMDEVNAGVQNICSEAIVQSYSDALVKYSLSDDYRIIFQQSYIGFLSNCQYKYDVLTDDYEWQKATASDEGSKNFIYKYQGSNDYLKGKYVYNLSVLESFFNVDDFKENDDDKIKIKLTAVDEDGNEITDRLGIAENIALPADGDNPDDTPDIILKGVCVEFTKNGRTTRISTDVTIDVPVISDLGNNGFTTTGINEHSCIVKGNLKNPAGVNPCYVYGSAYFGSVETTGSGQLVFAISDGDNNDARVVVGEGICINGTGISNSKLGTDFDNSSRLIVGDVFDRDKNIELWAESINVGVDATGSTSEKTKVTLAGETYVANDLVLQGAKAEAILRGKYFGFGESTTDPAESSSIISNGKGSSLDISDLDELDLAGYAFVGEKGYLKTSESVSGKENQRAYLIPAEFLTYNYTTSTTTGNDVLMKSNPEIMTSAVAQGIKQWETDHSGKSAWTLKDGTLWGSKTLSDYGVSEPQIIYENFSGSDQYTVYAFAVFGDTVDDDGNVTKTASENANEFFKAYFRYNADEIQEYMKSYLTVTGAASTASAVGATFTGNGSTVNLNDFLSTTEASSLSNLAMSNSDTYATLRANLATSDTYEDDDNPLSTILSTDLEELGDDAGEQNYVEYQAEVNGSPTTVAIAVNGDVEICKQNGTDIIKIDGEYKSTMVPSNISMILCTGTITVNGVAYDGLLCTEGDLILENGAILNRDPENVVKAYAAKDSAGNTITEYLNNETTGTDKVADAWSITGIVGYDNWSRSIED